MKLKRFLLRYQPPGIILEIARRNGEIETKSIDLLNLTRETDIDYLVETILQEEEVIKEERRETLQKLIMQLIEKQENVKDYNQTNQKTIKSHNLPLSNVCFNKDGTRFITGSQDRTCKLQDTQNGTEINTFLGHENVVQALAFNNPFGDKIVTGSFDRTANVWDINSGKCVAKLIGHEREICGVTFDPHSSFVASCSLDGTARIYDLERSIETFDASHGKFGVSLDGLIYKLRGHEKEVITVSFNTEGDKILTASFDNTAKIWDIRSGDCVRTFVGHNGELSNAQFEFSGDQVATASTDNTVKLWDVKQGQCICSMEDHTDEVLDVCFNSTGSKLCSVSSDNTGRIYDTMNGQCMSVLVGHEKEISKCMFNNQGTRVITASSDNTCKVWDADNGILVQTLEGHDDEVFSCAFNQEGDTIITGGKDNKCVVWKGK